ncbi:PTS sugar transporter subunit IIB [Lacticaseibacillus casei]|uniref:PTS sugar transporter subunit IIB n=1 Tax=Lacticaseibacillus huelsenbergensis TaxID=3035291 RepID=A0ABY8DYM1_9LACO|nr:MULTISPECIES: PTS sugar transporter subunit IIB [Lacticaseibacillus]MDG3063095.1 PTS sugar transporter subunit IIB [Lacticaseibacillus sp. BCRC 81376]QVI36637.1 PTS sugar transporter subunit IIB [Lacticaseibacillus casei]QXG58429.1 PTS sugar transporter subunit IIB [Lacticaseibacillus casei]WFB40103.1 PTS sugar transporter subunit IIB [Lacticaseibacillus huelsenbergensis]WFB41836.1 PTS sugar transporter subunit IIB [Lacticaseibacillus huelsenbergensis]
MTKRINLLAVCGSGTVTSSMVAGEIQDELSDDGYTVKATEARPTEAKQLIDSGKFDLVVYTSPLPKADYGVPVINGTGLLTGIGEDEFWEELKKTVAGISAKA